MVFKKVGRCDPDSPVRRGNLEIKLVARFFSFSGIYSVGAITTRNESPADYISGVSGVFRELGNGDKRM